MICSAPGSDIFERIKIYGNLLKANIKTGCSLKESASLKTLKRDWEEANNSRAKLAIIMGEEESKGDKLTVKNLENV